MCSHLLLMQTVTEAATFNKSSSPISSRIKIKRQNNHSDSHFHINYLTPEGRNIRKIVLFLLLMQDKRMLVDVL